jgi:hypothetical protein
VAEVPLPQQVDKAFHSEDGPKDQSHLAVIARYRGRVKNPLTAIRAYCVECSGGQPSEVAACPVEKCILHPFRMGTNPHNKKVRDRLAAQAGDNADEGDDE